MDSYVTELTQSDKKAWKIMIKNLREDLIKSPYTYAKIAMETLQYTEKDLRINLSDCLFNIRELAWQRYLQDESEFHRAIMKHLISNTPSAHQILTDTAKSFNLNVLSDSFAGDLSVFIGDYIGRIMPFIYELTLSTTNSRRARSGTTFEELVYYLMDQVGIPYVRLSEVGNLFLEKTGLSKKVDLLIPDEHAFTEENDLCHVIIMKTSLRERWQEVIEEISRTNVPHVYLFTLDDAISQQSLDNMARHSITVVTYASTKKRYLMSSNIISFEDYFFDRVPRLMGARS
jgi:hypothetical protein